MSFRAALMCALVLSAPLASRGADAPVADAPRDPATPPPAPAQAGPPGMGKPAFELSAAATVTEGSHIKRTDEDFRLGQYELEAKYYIKKQFPIPQVVTVDLLRLDVDTESNAVPEELVDLSATYMTEFATFENGWYVGGIIGAGYAGDRLGDQFQGHGKAHAVGRILGLVDEGADSLPASEPALPLQHSQRLAHRHRADPERRC